MVVVVVEVVVVVVEVVVLVVQVMRRCLLLLWQLDLSQSAAA